MTSMIECLLHQNGEELGTMYLGPYKDTIFENMFGPVPDGVEFNTSLVETLLAGDLPPNVTYLMGSNLDEGTEFASEGAPLSCEMTPADLATWASQTFGDQAISANITVTYGEPELPWPLCYDGTGLKYNKDYVGATRAIGDSTFTCFVRALGDRVLTESDPSFVGSNVYTYYWTHQPQKSLNMGSIPLFGAFHGSEVPFVFGYPAELNSAAEIQLARSLGCYWANFAHTGDPNQGPCNSSATAPVAWEPYRKRGSNMGDPSRTLKLDVEEGLLHRSTMQTDLRKTQCNLFESLLPRTVAKRK